MYAGSLFIKYLLGWNVYLSAFILVILTVVYTVAGGLSTVMWTDTVQSGIIILGAGTIAIKSECMTLYVEATPYLSIYLSKLHRSK